ncbi:MAG TPA: FAD binding domain-containing protein [Burkholderiales bacterium]|nr:FAD binding domain-containing protein [Burkholderiales bacterium]
MKAAAFDYVRARDVGEALAALRGADGEGKPIAGGQSLGPMLNLRLARPKLLVDVSRIDSLRGVEDEGDAWRIGSAVTHAELEDRPLAGCEPLAKVARVVAYRAVRNRGTVGGSLAHADPAADWPLVFAALDAVVRVTAPSGTREIRAEAFMTAAFTTPLADDEIVESVRVPKLGAGARWGYYKFCRKTGEFPEASAALLLDPERRVARLFVGALDRPPQPLESLARALAQEGAASDDMIDAALARVAPGMGVAARRLRATAVKRAIRAS